MGWEIADGERIAAPRLTQTYGGERTSGIVAMASATPAESEKLSRSLKNGCGVWKTAVQLKKRPYSLKNCRGA
jgi:hypothetical protein